MGKKKNRTTKINISGPNTDVDIAQTFNSLDDCEYPLFSFKYLTHTSYVGCRDCKFFINFIKRLQALSALGWKEIRLDKPHGYGMEPIPKTKIKPSLPSIVTPEVENLHVFRATGDNHPFVGLQIGSIFYVFFIETTFGDIYDHGKK